LNSSDAKPSIRTPTANDRDFLRILERRYTKIVFQGLIVTKKTP
jgi:hypothetical protein